MAAISQEDIFEAIDEAARLHGEDSEHFRKIVGAESSFLPGQVSSRGVEGMAGVTYKTMQQMLPGGTPSNDAHSLYAGAKYSKHLQDLWKSRGYSDNEARKLSTASYNGGPGSWTKAYEQAQKDTTLDNPLYNDIARAGLRVIKNEGESTKTQYLDFFKDSLAYKDNLLGPEDEPLLPQGLESKLKEYTGTSDEDISFFDSLNIMGQGVTEGVDVLGHGLKLLGAEDIGEFIQGIAEENMQIYRANRNKSLDKYEGVSPTISTGEGFFDFKWNPKYGVQSAVMDALKSLPVTMATVGTGAVLQAAALQTAKKFGLKMTGKLAAGTGVVSFGTAEGVVEGLFSSKHVEETVLQLDERTLSKSPYYKELREKDHNHEDARALVARFLGNRTGLTVGSISAILGAPMGMFFGKLMGGQGSRSIAKNTMKGIFGEMGQESLQSGDASMWEDLAKEDAGMEMDILTNMRNSMIQGGITGGLVGGPFGAITTQYGDEMFSKDVPVEHGVLANMVGAIDPDAELSFSKKGEKFIREPAPTVDSEILRRPHGAMVGKERVAAEDPTILDPTFGAAKNNGDGTWSVYDHIKPRGMLKLDFVGKDAEKKAKAAAKEVQTAIPPGKKTPEPIDLDVAPTTKRQRWGKQFVDKFDPLSGLEESDNYKIVRYEALGSVYQSNTLGKDIDDTYRKASKADQKAIKTFMGSKADPSIINDEHARHIFQRAKETVIAQGQEAVNNGTLSKEVFEANKGTYLPRLYLRFILTGKTGITGGSGVSPQGYLKTKLTEEEFDEPTRKILYGEIENTGFLTSHSIGIIGRDQALLKMLGKVANNPKWVLPQSVVEWNGKKVSATWLAQEAGKVREIADNQPTPELQSQTIAKAKEMSDIAAPGLNHENIEGYTQVPTSRRYGRLAGMFVKTPIYSDIIETSGRRGDMSIFEQWLGTDGKFTKGIQLWKMMKVALNPPTQFRNFFSNMILLNLSGVPMHMIPTRLYQAWREIMNNGQHWQIVKHYGAPATTFSNQEMYRINRRFINLEAEGGSAWKQIKAIAALIGEKASDLYQFSETLGKTAKVIHEMEANGASPERAILDAQEALFDYSLVPPGVRYLRNAPIGIPFLTFQYKVLPILIKTAIQYPQRLLPYAALPMLMLLAFMQINDVDKEDLEALKESAYEYMRDKGQIYVLPYRDQYGRWAFLDFTYYLPWSFYQEILHNAYGVGKKTITGDGKEIADVLNSGGILGGPITEVITAWKTGLDPFTRRPITNPSDTPKRQAVDYLNWMWRVAAPPWTTNRGAAIKAYDTITRKGNPRTGEPTLTPGQAAGRWIGANIYPVDPEMTRMDNLKFMKFEIDKIKRRMKKLMRDKGISEKERERIRKDYMKRIKRKTEHLRAYAERTEIHPNLSRP